MVSIQNQTHMLVHMDREMRITNRIKYVRAYTHTNTRTHRELDFLLLSFVWCVREKCHYRDARILWRTFCWEKAPDKTTTDTSFRSHQNSYASPTNNNRDAPQNKEKSKQQNQFDLYSLCMVFC